MTVTRPPVTVQPRPALGHAEVWQMPAVATTEVGPGLRVHAIHLPDRRLVALRLRLDGPVTSEPLDVAGVGTIAARALDEGTANHDGDSFAAALDRIGADWGPSVGHAGAMISTSAPNDQVPAALALLAEAVTTATFPQRDVDRIVGQRRDRIAQSMATPSGRASVAMLAAAVDPAHRASLPSAGTDATMQRIDREAVVRHHADRLLAGPADLVVVGDLSGMDVPALAADALAHFVPIDRPRVPADPLRMRGGPRLVLVDHPGAVQSDLRVVRPGPDVHALDRAAARVLGHILGGPLTSRLDHVLREDRGYTYGVRSSVRSFRRGGMFVVASGSFETSTTAEALDLVRSLTSELALHGPTEAEVVASRDYLTGVIPLSLETPQALAGVVAGNIGDDLPTTHTTTHLRQLAAVTTDDVAAAAQAHLAADDLVAVVVGDMDQVRDDLVGLGWGAVVEAD